MPSIPVRVALFGFGSSSTIFHLPFLLAQPKRFEVVAVLDRKGIESARRLPEARIYSSWEDMVQDPHYDLAVVTLPNSLHASVACAILDSGRHVVIEKPLSVTKEESERILISERLSGKKAFVYHNRRFDGDFLLVRDWLASGRLGRLVRAEVRMDRWSPSLRKKAWKETGEVGSTLLEDLGSHLLDQSLQLFGTPSAVTCRTAIQRDGSHSGDAFRISLDYEGFWVDLESSLIARWAPYHWLLQGTEGTLMIRGVDPQEAQLGSGMSPLDASFGFEPGALSGEFWPASGDPENLIVPPGHYATFYNDVWESLQGLQSTSFAASGGAEVVRLLDAARRSHDLSRTIQLP